MLNLIRVRLWGFVNETSARANPRLPRVVMGTWHRPTVGERTRKLHQLAPDRLAPGQL
jgi:hypothetical protein